MVSTDLSPIERAKRDAAFACGKRHVKPGCRLGVGSGSTVRYLVEYLGSAYKEGTLPGLECVPSSYLTKRWLLDAGLPVTDLDHIPSLDVCIDGADEVLPFAANPIIREITNALGGSASIRMATNICAPVMTDNGAYIVDWSFPKEEKLDWISVQNRLASIPGVIETGLFLNVVDEVFFAYADGNVLMIPRDV